MLVCRSHSAAFAGIHFARNAMSQAVKTAPHPFKLTGARSLFRHAIGPKPIARREPCCAVRAIHSDKSKRTAEMTAASSSKPGELYESPYTIPNALTTLRILACPVLGYFIVQGNWAWATGLLVASGASDWLDGYIARKWNSRSVLGSILDPAADKALMTTLVATLAWSGQLPTCLIFGRDLGLSISAFYFRYISLSPPRTWGRYFDPTIPSAEVKPTQISKINTALQLLLMSVTTVKPLLPFAIDLPVTALHYVVAATTIWSGLSYLGKAGAGCSSYACMLEAMFMQFTTA